MAKVRGGVEDVFFHVGKTGFLHPLLQIARSAGIGAEDLTCRMYMGHKISDLFISLYKVNGARIGSLSPWRKCTIFRQRTIITVKNRDASRAILPNHQA